MKVGFVAVTVNVDPFLDGQSIERSFRYPVDYPHDFYWIFSGCLEDWGNDHSVCPGDVKLRKGFRGHCVCGCHR